MAEKNAWLLTWNPKKASEEGRDGTPDGRLGIEVGEEKCWGCQAKKPKVGDIVYMLRQGSEPRGIVAKGVVIKKSFHAKARTHSRKVPSIKFKLLELRETCSEGLLPFVVLKQTLPSQHWTPNGSGISIKSANIDKLNKLWTKGKGKHSLRQCYDIYLKSDKLT